MGFTIEDMLVVSQDRYQMKLAAGKGGWSNSIAWLLMLEERTIIRNFSGKELAVTTGLGFQTEESLLELLSDLLEHHASGLIINIGPYIGAIPDQAVRFCDENDFPLLTVPWNVFLADMIKDLSIRVFLQSSTDEQISEAMIHAIEKPDARDLYVQQLLPFFDVDGIFQVMLISIPDLDKMDTVERKRLGYRIQIYLSNITHNAHFFYYDSVFVLAINAVSASFVHEIVRQFEHNQEKRMPHHKLTAGIGSPVTDITSLHISYRRARAAVSYAEDRGLRHAWFDEMGIYRLLYSVPDRALLSELSSAPLAPLLEYDQKHHANYVETLEQYLACDGSIQAVADSLFTHRNTVLYRMNNIRQLLGCSLETQEEKLQYQIACLIRHMK